MQIGPYTVLAEIARGGMGVVYRAQGADGQVAALKLIQVHKAADPRARRRFQSEVQALARLRHPNVVPILGAGEYEGAPWLALEFVEGESLQERLRHGPLPIWAAIRITQQLAQALSYVHSCGLLHRDLKPDNVLLRGNQALLTDFGLVLDDQSSVSRISATGIFQGTPGYWAPEQAKGQLSQFGPTTDVYGLGAVLYACLTGSAPVVAGSLQQHLQTVEFKRIPAPERVRAEVPRWLSELCMRCLSLDPTRRPASADEVARALVMAGDVALEPGAAPRRPVALVVGAVGALLVAGLAAALVWGGQGPALEPGPTEPEQPRSVSGPLDSAERRAQAAALKESGDAKEEAGHFVEAIADYDAALDLDPGLTLAYVKRGDCKVQLGRHAKAIEDYERALELDPRSAEAYAGRAESSEERGLHEEAIADCDRALELDPRNVKAYSVRGLANMLLKRHAEAIEDFSRSLEFGPPNASTHVSRAWNWSELGRHEEAIADLEGALRLEPAYALARSRHGWHLAQLGRHEEAIADYDRALELGLEGRGAEVVKRWRAESVAKLGRESPAAAAGEELTEQLLVKLANDKLRERRYEEAVDLFGRLIKVAPQGAEGYLGRGVAKARLGRAKEAIEDLDRALELDPRNFVGYVSRAAAKGALGDFLGAIEDYDRVLELDPRREVAYLSRGAAKTNLGRHEEAIEDYDRMLELDPGSAEAYLRRGASKDMLGRLAEAVEDYDRALALGLSASRAETANTLRAEAVERLSRE